ncbi:type II secretion system F family protein [Cupriavidus oxalaticus]|uniref:Flp pilus assembly protein TadC n=1 Tax=Cupriavidus oxalaticus TaxID=96344 RepID=A0A375GGH2_9BURK|nr:type II secretion system F family protein [Cupriavidus oxalaticus]QRQ84384.1 type II secretion system F family protein [Cupriavidus oxalaticus]QRQ91529.1 type II secretion system F family protein [Cupriavidus oxalaticus]WQD86099.1 type II secretion system F family protein [Cupriavidus oxalaticus]SPC19609.1 Flp pilus assembly protein TadC [Cupriavidus oxalaticus]
MDRLTLISLSLLAAACGVAVLALPLLRDWRQRRLAARTIDAALARPRAAEAAQAPAAAQPHASAAAGVQAAARAAVPAGRTGAAAIGGQLGAQLGARVSERIDAHWLESRLGRAVVTPEDQQLLEQCGWHGLKARMLFGALRLVLPLALSLAAMLGHVGAGAAVMLAWGFGVFAVAYLVPKTLLRRRAAARLRLVDDELPVLIDMLRLLQGVGLSIDQSLQVIVAEFGGMLRVLGPELARANQQFASGRSREQTLLRISRLFDNEDLKGLIMLLTQVDRHGGAVQEPLRQFGLRLQEARKARMKEQIGRLTVKMTAVMVVSLLPVLLIITAGPGFLGVIRMLEHMGGTQ